MDFLSDGRAVVCSISGDVWRVSGIAEKLGTLRWKRFATGLNQPLGVRIVNDLELRFSDALDATEAADKENYTIQQGNYRWQYQYGSPLYKVTNPEQQGRDPVEIRSIRVSQDRKTVFLEIPDLRPVMQMQIGYILKAADGTELRHTIHNTINRVPSGPAR